MLNAFAAHVYAGGLAVGVADHFNLTGMGEHDGYGNEIKALNFPGVPLYATYPEWPKGRGKGAKAMQFIFGNPPCAPFSAASAGRELHWSDDPRLQFWKDIVRLIPESQPDILAIESVVPAWIAGRPFIDRLAATAAGWGYSTTILLHNAMYLGAVQNRKRVFFVFHRVSVDLWPKPPTFDTDITVRKVLKSVKVSALSKKRYKEECELKGLRLQLYNAAAEGENLHRAFNRLFGPDAPRHPNGNVIGRPTFLTRRLAWDKAGQVYMGTSQMLHPTEPRALYPEEINAYTGFPPDWKWPDYPLAKLSTFASQGVSPLGGRWLGWGAKEAIERAKKVKSPDYGIMDGLSEIGWDKGRQIITDDPADYAEPYTMDDLIGPPQEPKKARKARETGGTRAPKDWDDTAPQGSRKPGVGAFIRTLLSEGTLTADILQLVSETFPDSKATAADVSWNRAKLRKEGVAV